MTAVAPADLAALLGVDVEDDLSAEQAQAVIDIVTALVKSATRGNGFVSGEPVEDLRAVILTASARLWRHPSQIDYGETKGPESIFFRSGFDGFTVAENYAISRFRVKAL
jgi:hypothetical protein